MYVYATVCDKKLGRSLGTRLSNHSSTYCTHRVCRARVYPGWQCEGADPGTEGGCGLEAAGGGVGDGGSDAAGD